MLNTSKGPAVHSLRAQADRKRYQMEMKHTLEKQENLELKQAEIVNIEVEKLVFCFANSVNSGKQLTFLIPPFSVSKKVFSNDSK